MVDFIEAIRFLNAMVNNPTFEGESIVLTITDKKTGSVEKVEFKAPMKKIKIDGKEYPLNGKQTALECKDITPENPS